MNKILYVRSVSTISPMRNSLRELLLRVRSIVERGNKACTVKGIITAALFVCFSDMENTWSITR